MPDNLMKRASDLMDRYRFTCTVLITEATRIHEVKECCIPEPCPLMRALTASVARLAEEGVTIHAAATNRSKRRATARRAPKIVLDSAGNGAPDAAG